MGSTRRAVIAKKIWLYDFEDRIDMPAFNRFRSFEALDSCHQQIQSNLDQLAILSEQLIAGNLDADARKQAESIELFFSTVARGHHAMEEDEVFPALLICDIAETVAKVDQVAIEEIEQKTVKSESSI